ncbi:non-hydrolyzing UDP-N-acetylglucosamine 2-epimerase [Selenomonas ruminantium]|uniref:non-hydrolyzing UDP-N-acetylglucosamine 2-epimerase n=1 Tax=Selenomonas ruminantium TaxID=971 RepID=UPI0026EA337E|nr:UDP-N-acetylglucosamine 2-epimerase (non-hydrolyzing) [Selenomonas ruminantium]
MKILTVVGARPQFIKAAVVSHVLRKKHQEVLVHTGQHFDYNMSQQFFDELSIPAPDYNLGISGGSHGEMTGRMLIELEKVLQKEQPDWVLLYGDTNSTLAAALAAAKLHIPICHVEAGTRTHCRTNPEEINRICTDHVSSLLLGCTDSAMDEMKCEGLADRGLLVGDPMYDAFLEYSGKREVTDIELQLLNGGTAEIPEKYCYLTCHREENTNRDEDLQEIFKAMEQLEFPVIYPVHPRNQARALRVARKMLLTHVILAKPVGYLESACMVKNAQLVITDSGGLQREAFFAGKKCVTLLDFVVWPETMVGNRNVLARPKAEDILEKIAILQEVSADYHPFGDGHAADKIVQAIEAAGK